MENLPNVNLKSRLLPGLLIYHLQLLTENRDIYLLNHWLIKGYYSRTTRYQSCMGQDMGKGCRTSLLSTGIPLAPNLCIQQIGRSSAHSFWVFMEASLCRHDWLYHWPLGESTSSPSLLPKNQRVIFEIILKMFHSSIHGWFPWQPALILKCFTEVTSLT